MCGEDTPKDDGEKAFEKCIDDARTRDVAAVENLIVISSSNRG